jgi:hypothetical protein
MTESNLADEICTLANLARLKGQASLLGSLAASAEVDDTADHDTYSSEDMSDIVDKLGMPLATPEQAEAAQAEVFAARYGADT